MSAREVPGPVVTFYSFKGGTGRTLALANVACALARRAERRPVLVVDWDLEAPGLHEFFPPAASHERPRGAASPSVDAGGLLELLEAALARCESSTCPAPEAGLDEAVPFVEALLHVARTRPTAVAGVSLLPAGRMDSSYAARVNTFDWQRVQTKMPWLYRALAQVWGRSHAFTLVDSRTGFTDASGVCAALMPEKLVVVFTPNRQSLAGVEELVRRAVRHRRASRDVRPLAVFPLPSRLEASEPDLRTLWRHGGERAGRAVPGYEPLFETLLREAYESSVCRLGAYFDAVGIEHVAALAYGERLVVAEDSPTDELSPARAYERFAERLALLQNPWDDYGQALAARKAEGQVAEGRRQLAAGDRESARSCASAAFATLDEAQVEVDVGAADLFAELARLYEESAEWDAALDCETRAVTLRERGHGERGARLAGRLARLTDLACRAGRLDDAAAHARRALELAEQALGKDRPEGVAPHLARLADVLEARGDAPQALQYRTRSLDLGVTGDVRRSVVVQGDENIVIVDPSWLLRHLGAPRPATSDELPRATAEYLAFVVDRYRYLEFKGMGVSDRVPLKLPLVEMYVPLAARVELPRAETWARDERAARALEAEDMHDARASSRPVPVLDLLRRHDGLIVLGDPGAGKTTLLKYLALRLAQGEAEELGLGPRLPVLVPLSAYAAAFAEREQPLDEFVAAYFASRGIELPVGPLLKQALARGAALVLLDGLDEVRGERGQVMGRVMDYFAFHRKAGNKFLITSRIVGYREVRPTADGLGECTLVDFEDDDVTAFVEKWTAAVEKAARGGTPAAAREAQREKDELLHAVTHNHGVRGLAANPLLLTILALMKRQGVALPERRVELYQNYVETLLKHWNRARGLDRQPARDLDVVETLRVLAPLALWMHETSPGVGLVESEKVRARLESIYASRGVESPDAAARRLLEDVREHAGLLLERGPRQYGFIHLTFQEYLAAMALAQQAQQDVEPVARALALHLDDATWREVSLLVVGYVGIVQQREEAAGAVLERLLRDRPGEPGQAVELCGAAVADAWPGGVSSSTKTAVIGALLETMRDDEVPAPRRAAAGDTLSRVGDPRFRADAWHLPDEPLLGFVEVPEGPFLMGVKKKPGPTLPRYFIGRYPVTVAQFRAFHAEGGEVGDIGALRGPVNRPVVWVSWHEAMAYAAWLTGKLRDWGAAPEPLARMLRGQSRQRWRVTLPGEAEWEKAARGTDGREYPWGNANPDARRCNFSGAEIGAPSPVGCFPHGASPYGVEDLSGNVWEWTRDLADHSEASAARKRAAAPPGRDGIAKPDDRLRALRGGAFNPVAADVRAAVRLRNLPGRRLVNIGFRVVLSPF